MNAAQKIVLSIDTSHKIEAQQLAAIAKKSGAKYIKMGLQLATATSWQWCSELAFQHDLEWIADAKLDDIPNTVASAVGALKSFNNPPFAITVHATTGLKTMRKAQETAGGIKMLGVTVLTSLDEQEANEIFGMPVLQKVMELAEKAIEAGLAGLVCSPQEVVAIKENPGTKNLFLMIPGSRSAGADAADQARVATPAETIKAGADLLVIGRQITQAADPEQAFKDLVLEIEAAVEGA